MTPVVWYGLHTTERLEMQWYRQWRRYIYIYATMHGTAVQQHAFSSTPYMYIINPPTNTTARTPGSIHEEGRRTRIPLCSARHLSAPWSLKEGRAFKWLMSI